MIKLIKEYKEGTKQGLRVYHCSNCNHDFNTPKGKEIIKCIYCGEELKEEKG